MLMVQTFHSIHEIDPEFISSLELLLEDEVPSFSFLEQSEDLAPETDTFTYFLFFGPTQNAPIGFSRLSLRKIPWQNYVPWWKRLMFWNKDYLHWKQVSWLSLHSSEGPCVFDPKFKRSGKEKMISIFRESMNRSDFVAGEISHYNEIQDYEIGWNECFLTHKKMWILGAYERNCKSYQDYLESLPQDITQEIKQDWKTLHKNLGIKLGDYPELKDAPALSIDDKTLDKLKKLNPQILTFEKDSEVLGCLIMLKGKNGNYFFEPFVFEKSSEPLVSEVLYSQYALLKFFEFPDARKCHLLKDHLKLTFDQKDDALEFELQGFKLTELKHSFSSKLKRLELPL